MNKFVFQNPTKLIFGKDQLQRLPKELAGYGKKVLLVYGGGSIKRNGLYDSLMKLLNENDFEVVEMGESNPIHVYLLLKEELISANSTMSMLFWRLAAVL